MEKEQEREALQAWKERVGQELDRVVAFWVEHSHDQEHGCVSPLWCPQQGSLPLLSPHLALRGPRSAEPRRAVGRGWCVCVCVCVCVCARARACVCAAPPPLR